MRNLKKFNKALSSFVDGQVTWAAGLLQNPAGKPPKAKMVKKPQPMEWDEVYEPVKEEASEIPEEKKVEKVPKPETLVARVPEEETPEKSRLPSALPPKRERLDKLKPVVLTSRGQQKEKERFKAKPESSESTVGKSEEAVVEQPKASDPIPVVTKGPEVTAPEEEFEEEAPVTEVPPATPTRGARIFLLMIYILGAGIFVIFLMGLKIMTQSMHVEELDRRIQALQEEAEKKRDYMESIVAPSGIIRGQVILRSGTAHTRQPVPRVSVMLYSRAQVDEALKTYQEELNSAPGDFAKIKFPAAIVRTISDSAGFYSLDVPEPGNYVLMARVNVPKKGTRMWLLEIDSRDAINTPIDLTDMNRLASPTKAPIVNLAR